MNKHSIKIIKKESRPALNRVALKRIAGASRIIGDERSLVKTVKNWIDERHRNRKAEGVFSDTQLVAWKMEPDTSE